MPLARGTPAALHPQYPAPQYAFTQWAGANNPLDAPITVTEYAVGSGQVTWRS